MNFDQIFNWRLLSGSHDFPGPDGGTCINEAAIIAAGFEYRKVNRAADCPPCFSPVLSAYLLGINDMMPDGERQKLMRFVVRLSGSADAEAVEQARLELIILRTTQRIVSLALRAGGLDSHATACAAAEAFGDCGDILTSAADAASAAWAASAANAASAAWAASAANAASAAWAASAVRDARDARDASAAWAARAVRDARDASAASAAWAARDARDASAAWAARAALYGDAIAIAEEAFAIGKQAPASDIAAVSARLDSARRLVNA